MQPRKPSKGLTFFLSFVPGVGHLYLGAMNRGLQIMIIFFGSIFLIDFLRLGAFPFWLPIIWFYGIFDALQKADDYLLYGEIVDKPLFEWQVLSGKNTWFGWGLIVIGSYLLLDRFLGRWIATYLIISWHDLRSIITAVLLIAFGAFLLWGRKVKNNE
ncbi:MAG: hypothetical protein Q7J85_04085 [Bacillota bacterium]|nr:hypothetical protein [Bacillota bacterium]